MHYEQVILGLGILILVMLGVSIAMLILVKRYSERQDSELHDLDIAVKETRTRLDTIDVSLGDLDIRSSKGIETNKTKLAEFKKEQNNRCDRLAKRLEILEDAAGNIESVGNLTEEVKSFGRRLKELDALVDRSAESISAASKLGMSNQEAIGRLANSIEFIRQQMAVISSRSVDKEAV